MLELSDCTFYGHALPEPFVKFELERRLTKGGLLAKTSGPEGKELQDEWETYRRVLRNLGATGGPIHVLNHVVAPLGGALGYGTLNRQETVETREGEEDGGWVFSETPGGVSLRAFASDVSADLDAPGRRGRAYRFSPERVAQRVLLARGERAALLTNGLQLRLLLCDPARPESHVGLRLDRGSGGWAGRPRVPDSFRLLVALASPRGLTLLPELVEAARLNQTTVTKNLRKQARAAVEGFIQEVLDRPENAEHLSGRDGPALARELWREGLILVYRLLFTLKLEASADPARAFSFASTTLWRNTFSPNAALGPVARDVLKEHAETGRLLEDGLRTMFRLFSSGISASELKISALGGALFGEGTTPLLDSLHWGERAVAKLLVNLLWTEGKDGEQRVHYGTLDVEDLGRVYESLLELEPGISGETMCRLRRQKLEVVVPLAQGEAYREKAKPSPREAQEKADGEDEVEESDDADEAPRGKKTKVLWIEEIPAGRFFLRVGLGRKSTGAYYTPHPFVRFLVQETLGPQVAERSPASAPNPGAILKLNVLDPATGSGHFLVEACRFLGEKLYEACRLCDELAVDAEEAAEKASAEHERDAHRARATELRSRVEALPDPNNQMLAYLPGRVPEGESAGLSQSKALALARRLVAVHCLYGVDKNPLAVELAKLALWLESYAEGLPLTFLDHRLVCGDSLTGSMFQHLLTDPGSGQKLDDLFTGGLKERLAATLNDALANVRDLEASVGKDVADLEAKRGAKARLDEALAPFRLLAAAWSGGVMLGRERSDSAAYEALVRAVAEQGDVEAVLATSTSLSEMVATGREGVPYDIAFPEVFWREGAHAGFDVVLGNPPWEKVKNEKKALVGAFDFSLLKEDRRSRWESLADLLLSVNSAAAAAWGSLVRRNLHLKRLTEALYKSHDTVGGDQDLYILFGRRAIQLLTSEGITGLVLSGGFRNNAASFGLRKLLFLACRLVSLRHFHNARRLFGDLPAIVEFNLVVSSPGGWRNHECGSIGLDLLRFEDLLYSSVDPRFFLVSQANLARTASSQLVLRRLPESKHSGVTLLRMLQDWGINLGRDVDRSLDEDLFAAVDTIISGDVPKDGRDPKCVAFLLQQGYAPLFNPRSFHQYDSQPRARAFRWNPAVDLCVDLDRVDGVTREIARYFRLAIRGSSGSPKTNPRTLISALLCPGCLTTHNCMVERTPSLRPTTGALKASAILNSFSVDARLRPVVGAYVTQVLLDAVSGPDLSRLEGAGSFLVHAALRVTCNHHGYEPVWREQVGDAWREPKPLFTWPVLEGDGARWAVLAAIDAVVADAYGLTHEQYAHVLSTFSHRRYGKAPVLCLAAFDELKSIGVDVFAKKHDPYWDIPLNEGLPKAVIDIPIPAGAEGQLGLALDDGSSKGGVSGTRANARRRRAKR